VPPKFCQKYTCVKIACSVESAKQTEFFIQLQSLGKLAVCSSGTSHRASLLLLQWLYAYISFSSFLLKNVGYEGKPGNQHKSELIATKVLRICDQSHDAKRRDMINYFQRQHEKLLSTGLKSAQVLYFERDFNLNFFWIAYCRRKTVLVLIKMRIKLHLCRTCWLLSYCRTYLYGACCREISDPRCIRRPVRRSSIKKVF